MKTKKLGSATENSKSTPVNRTIFESGISLRDQSHTMLSVPANAKKPTKAPTPLTPKSNAAFPAEFRAQMNHLWIKEGANKLFRTKEDFTSWLNFPNISLAGRAPIQFIETDIKQISDLLGRILHGILA